MSASAASSAWAASFLPASASSMAALSTAAPPCCSDREPIVPSPTGVRSVSPHTSVNLSIGMPVLALAIIDHAVSWPWPCGDVPV